MVVIYIPIKFVQAIRLLCLAGEDAGAGDLVAGDRRPVDADLDSGVGAGVGTGERDCRGSLRTCAADNVYLRTFHVELGTGVVA